MGICKWLPDLFDEPDWNNYYKYEERLYNLFKTQIIDTPLLFRNKPIKIRRIPMENNKEEAFYHCTCKNYTDIQNRSPDPERMIRLPWLSAIIQNYNCKEDCCDEKPLLWRKLAKSNNYRYHIYFNDYLVILEERADYVLLITAFYVEEDYYHRKLIKDSQKPENAVE